ncbi:twin transmembrane helix small protein [Fulvimarina sp. 2208YS6-2-32]|uniref:Twin transmembrane helix small protein n=1 Tax=Fulvimarina uroteuthidis TaxID=3098149 RepID=A0ABU5I2S5_9HYPH|nr:twin transmembrane helix small protein [Fulvimarina sp. 2208YS6-2-32]MDY8109640.1 twin transmembrane helix small protein [Fulvimarina sp. 2208YS6-2-32]
MSGFLTFLAISAMVATAIVLLAGLLNLMKDGPGNRSQKLMRYRILFQAIAVVLIVLFLVFGR